ncbi:hypothetical protein [Solidesulfovibrio sp.]
MNGPWSDAARAWTAMPAAWGQWGEEAVVAVGVGAAGAGLAARPALAAALARPVGDGATARLLTPPGGLESAVAAGCLVAGLVGRVGSRDPLVLVRCRGGALELAGRVPPVAVGLAATGPVRAVALALAAGPCLAGTGIREVCRLVSALTTTTRLRSRAAGVWRARSSIDIEQT